VNQFLGTIMLITRKHSMLETMNALQNAAHADKILIYGKELDDLKETVTPMLRDLEKEFQAVLGIYNEKK
jgi:hypothetical protein